MAVEYSQDLDENLSAARELFREYARTLGFDLSFQGFEQELAELPGKYAPPHGTLIVARQDGVACGCVALRRIDPGVCEMKRLYVRPDRRGQGIGAELVRRVIETARGRGYRIMRLDTVTSMKSAIGLYRGFGFSRTEPYIYNPLPGALFMEKELAPPSAQTPPP